MKGPVLIVPKRRAETVRQKLAQLDLLERDASVVMLDKEVGFPLKDGADLPKGIPGKVEEMEYGVRQRRPRSYKDLLDLPEGIVKDLPSSFDMIGEVCIIKLPFDMMEYSEMVAEAIVGANRSIRKVALDRGVKGEYRVRELQPLIGGPDLETTHIENNIRIQLDPSKVYFSPRLATERLRIAQMTGQEKVLDMFAGVGPFSLTVARHSPAKEVVGIDLNPDCIRYFQNNIKLNSVEDRVTAILGDSNDVAPTMGPFDRIIMNLPHSSLGYLRTAVRCLDGQGMVHLYKIVQGQAVKEEIASIDAMMKEEGRTYSLEGLREVHQYSPDSHMMAFDIRVNGA